MNNLHKGAAFRAVIILCCVLFAQSCASFDVDKSISTSAASAGRKDGAVIPVPVDTEKAVILPPEVVVKERPVFQPEPSETGAKGGEAKLPGFSAVAEANAAGILPPAEYTGAAMIYDYDADWVYEVYTQPQRLTDIVLQAGETVLDKPFVSDSDRWQLGASVSREAGAEVQHVYVKPTEAGLAASLIINTDRRAYRLVLRSYGAQSAFMPIVRWRYAASFSAIEMPQVFAGVGENGGAEGGAEALPGAAGTQPSLDPRFLSFNYKVTWKIFKKPSWLPRLAYDDGRKTYIQFPEGVLQDTMPGVFENRDEVLNYRVVDNLIIIDKRIQKVTVRIKDVDCEIVKKGGA